MANINLNNAPFINQRFIVTGAFGEPRGTSFHRGIDLAPLGFAGSLYTICNCILIYKGNDITGYGFYCIFRESNSNNMFLYAHLESPTAINVGDYLEQGTFVGYAGQSGSATGVHLHLEMQNGSTWQYQAPLSTYINPCNYLRGLINVVSTDNIYFYNGIPYNPTKNKKHKFPWFIYFRKRNLKI